MKTLAERIAAQEAVKLELKDLMVEHEKNLDSDDQEVAAAALIAVGETADLHDKAMEDLALLRKAEASMATKALPASGKPTAPTSAAVVSPKSLGSKNNSAAADLFVKAGVCAIEAYVKRVPESTILEQRYGYDDEVKAVHSMVTKAAQPIADTVTTGWAKELTRESYAGFMELLSGESVVPMLPLERYEFGGFAKINIPSRSGTVGALPNLAGAFRAEGDPIRVGAASVTSTSLTPKSMGIIGTFTQELFERSTPNIEQAIRNWMIQDTAYALDMSFLGSTAGTTTVPAGIQTYATGGNTAASGGVTAAAITADLRGRLTAMAAVNLGRRPVWIMNPARAWGVSLALTAAGTPAFPDMQNGTLLGIPVVTSTNVPAGVVFLADAAEVAFAGGAPKFMGTDVATIHEEGLQSAVAPIVGLGTGAGNITAATDVANPVRSLFQTNSSALRAVWELDWTVTRTGAIQTITACAW